MSYLYNTTFVISRAERDWWLQWMETEYSAAMRGVVPDARHELYAIDESLSADPGSLSFSSQWVCEGALELGRLRDVSNALCSAMVEQKGEACLFFSTMMKSVGR